MNDRTRKADGRKRQERASLTAAQRAFAEHYAQNGDWVAACHHAYPSSLGWKSESLHSHISRLRANALVWDAIEAVRKPVLEQQQITFAWILQESVKQYRNADADKDRKDCMRWLKHIGRLIGVDPTGGAGMYSPPAGRGISDESVIDGDYRDLDGLPTERLIELAGAGGSSVAPGAGAAFFGAEEPERFRDLLRRPPASEAPPDPVHLPADGDRGADEPGDGVHAAGGSEVDLLQRIRASMGGRPEAGRCPHCGLTHDGACPELRPPGS